MFGFGKSKLEKLQKKHQQVLKEAFELSKIDRKKSDAKYAEANEIEEQMIELEKEK
ncbi:Lacal_2735 family protein [Portibacter marinus]|uniref:Lacal_2735 family protein n=1 Tax=Portibacter marinus TaxID=2898660 RepID=UPI001F190C50|nr:Lacal_2735 family protein [Portibacter marinus]